MDVPLPPLLPGLFPTTNSMIRGSGILCWLSPKAGLIICSKPVQATISFQLKDFCDSGITDLTQYLRMGFRLAFHAIPNNTDQWIANYVSPISEQDMNNGIGDGQELDLESFEKQNSLVSNMPPPPGKASKDPYSLEKEMRALSFLLSIFQKNTMHYIPLSNLHSRISNSGDPNLSHYIGSSSLKRRQFIEDRSYIFYLAENDVVYLQAPEVYQTVTLLTGFLLSHGGVTSSDQLFNCFNKYPNIPVTIKESIQNRRQNFMQFLSRHPFAFSPFPSQYYVSARRNLPYFDYVNFVRRTFPNFSSRPVSRPLLQNNDSFDHLNSDTSQISSLPTLHSTNTLNSATAAHHNIGLSSNGPSLTGLAGVSAAAINGLPVGAGGITQQQGPNFQQQPQSPHLMPSATQKPLFSLFDEPIMPPNAAQLNGQNGSSIGVGVNTRSLIGNIGSSNGPTVGVGNTSNNIWTYDMDFFDRTKITDVFSTAFNNIGISDRHVSPPRKQFVEKEIQTEESFFGDGGTSTLGVCAKCAQKISK